MRFVSVYPDKYVGMLLGEGGEEILHKVYKDATAGSDLHEHCRLLLQIINKTEKTEEREESS